MGRQQNWTCLTFTKGLPVPNGEHFPRALNNGTPSVSDLTFVVYIILISYTSTRTQNIQIHAHVSMYTDKAAFLRVSRFDVNYHVWHLTCKEYLLSHVVAWPLATTLCVFDELTIIALQWFTF